MVHSLCLLSLYIDWIYKGLGKKFQARYYLYIIYSIDVCFVCFQLQQPLQPQRAIPNFIRVSVLHLYLPNPLVIHYRFAPHPLFRVSSVLTLSRAYLLYTLSPWVTKLGVWVHLGMGMCRVSNIKVGHINVYWILNSVFKSLPLRGKGWLLRLVLLTVDFDYKRTTVYRGDSDEREMVYKYLDWM